MNYKKFYKYILKRNVINPDIAKNFEFNQNIKNTYGVQISLQNDLDEENLIISKNEGDKFIEQYGKKYEAIIDEYNTTIGLILDNVEIKTVYTFKSGKVKLTFPKVHMKALARDLSDHRLNLSKVHTAHIYKVHYMIYKTTFKMFTNFYVKATKKTKAQLGIQISEEQAKQFGYTYTLQRTYAGIKASITDVNVVNSILFIPASIGQFPVSKVDKKRVGVEKHNHLLM